MLVALYARVSTTDQKCESQLTELREYIGRRAWQISKEYVDEGFTGRSTKRPAYQQLMADASKHLFDTVVVSKLDRFGRSVIELNSNLVTLESHGVRFIAVTQGIDTDQTNPTSKLIMHILAAVAEFESGIIRERVRSGVRHAQKHGTRSGNAIGRPKKVFRRDQVDDLRLEGLSLSEIAQRLRIGYGTVRRELAKTHAAKQG
jgi:putative DNA-invertase from lambdoid prophage Rac